VKVLVVAAHPDDEVLGCGATIARHADAGDTVEILILGTGALSRGGAGPGDAERLANQAAEAARILGARRARVLDLPDNRFDGVDLLEIIRRVDVEIRRVGPEVVYTHHAGDLNVDHRRTFQAVLTACRPQGPGGVRKILSFEVPSSTEWQSPTSGPGFRPNFFVDVGATMARKEAALAAYAGEVRPFPHPRSAEAIRALGAWRGASAGLHAAEAFELVREVI
jgi:LmbE family N-acetylglucosaminyl deacetylase